LDVDAGLTTNRQRVERRTEVIGILEGAFSSLTLSVVIARLGSAGVPAGRVRTIDEVEVETTLQYDHPPPLLGASNTNLDTWLDTEPPSQ
jgi:crotonobetainyl-CoA:carnitine CoA-transferase CaiB-like acyl-CoA transferase